MNVIFFDVKTFTFKEMKRAGNREGGNHPRKQQKAGKNGAVQNGIGQGTIDRMRKQLQQGNGRLQRYPQRNGRYQQRKGLAEPVAGTSANMYDEQEDTDDEPADLDVLVAVFSDRDVQNAPKQSPGAPLQAMANFIIENPEKFPKKPAPEVEIPPDELEPTLVSEESMKRDAQFKSRLMDAFFEDFREHIGTHFTRAHPVEYDKELCNRLLHQHFPTCRTPFIELLVDEFRGRFSTSAWFCFFVEAEMSFLIRQYFLHVDQPQWMIIGQPMVLPRKRRFNWVPNPEEGPMADSVREFYTALRHFQADYQQLFHKEGKRLAPETKGMVQPMGYFECSVCTGQFPDYRGISCSPNGREGMAADSEEGTSKGAQRRKGEAEGHRFCVECLVGQARAATQEMPLAEGGIGLRCMEPDCANPILFSECRFFIPPKVRRQLNARIVEENLGAANLDNLERCKKCNFAMVIEATSDQLRVFSCRKCRAAHCRQCERPWDELHIGRPCGEMLNAKDLQQRVYENKLSEAIIRRCHRCSAPFVKDLGCNKMVCRCGATQCYLCRAQNINYGHFCQHYRDPGQVECNQCKKKCLLWQAEEPADVQALEAVRVEAEAAGVELPGAKQQQQQEEAEPEEFLGHRMRLAHGVRRRH